jgi:hypothetical protein
MVTVVSNEVNVILRNVPKVKLYFYFYTTAMYVGTDTYTITMKR